MKKIITALLIVNFTLILTVIGFVTSATVVLWILLILLSIVCLAVPSVMFYFLFKKYKQLRNAFDVYFNFMLLIEQQLKAVDQMQITNLQVVNLKQKIKSLRTSLRLQKKKRSKNVE